MNTIDKTQLTSKELLIFNQEVESQKKNQVMAYVIWWFFGFMGGHRYYFGKTGSAVAMTLIFWLLVWFLGLGLVITVIWALVDVFMIGDWLKEDQQKTEEKVYNDLMLRRKLNDQPVQPASQSQTTTQSTQAASSTSTTDESVMNSESSSMTFPTSPTETTTASQGTETISEQKRFCSNCGAPLVGGAQFCPNCGAKLG